MPLSESLVIDAVLLLVSIIFVYLTYNASVRLTKTKDVARVWVVALRAVTLGECIAIIYAIVDIPWSIILMFFPQFLMFDVLKYLIIYAILTTIIVAPAINQILKVPFAQRERERSLLTERRDDLLQEMKILTSKFLRKQISERVFVEVTKELEGKIVSVEAKMEKLKFGEEPKEMKELFKT